MKIVAKLMLKAEQEIVEKLKIINKDIEDFAKPVPIPSHLELIERNAWFDERQTGRLSSKKLKMNYTKKLILENELQDIVTFKYYHKEMFD